jgi:zinc/manganese transport system substrate-binding protein
MLRKTIPIAGPAAPRRAPAAPLLLALLGTLAAALPTGCERSQPAPAGHGPLRLVVTHSILGDLVARVSADRAALTVFVGPDGDAHTYEPTPADARALADADLLIENGLGFEPWIDKLYNASGSHARRIVASAGLQPRTLTEDGRTETDPHCWQDVRRAIRMVQNIADALANADPPGAAAYRANAAAYIAQLQELDDYIVHQTQSLPPERRVLVTSHDALGYFAERYGFKIVGSALASVTTEAADPSAQQMAAVIREVEAAHVPAVFTENMQNPHLMQQIASEAHVHICTSLYTDALGPPGSPGATYAGMMRHNIDAIVESLRP